jgi:hypothetical protein
MDVDESGQAANAVEHVPLLHQILWLIEIPIASASQPSL